MLKFPMLDIHYPKLFKNEKHKINVLEIIIKKINKTKVFKLYQHNENEIFFNIGNRKKKIENKLEYENIK